MAEAGRRPADEASLAQIVIDIADTLGEEVDPAYRAIAATRLNSSTRAGQFPSGDPGESREAGSRPAVTADGGSVGYPAPTVCSAAGIAPRQLDYWARTGLLPPSVRQPSGSGSDGLYSFKDVFVLKVVRRLLDTGVSLQAIGEVVASLRAHDVEDLAGVTLLSDGSTVYECTTSEEVVNLLSSGQGRYGIALSGVLRELAGSLATLPSVYVDAAANPAEHSSRLSKGSYIADAG